MRITSMRRSGWLLAGVGLVASAALPISRPALAQEVWRCGNAYYASPCKGGSTVDLTPPIQSHAPEGATPASPRPAPPRERARSRSSTSYPTQTTSDQTVNTRKAQCQELEDRVRQLDAQGRRGGSSSLMERLRHERQQARDQQFRLGCR